MNATVSTAELEPQLQRPDLNVESVRQADPVSVTRENLPWINTNDMEIPTVLVTTDDGTAFRFGSAVSGNHTLEKIASGVPADRSAKAERTMFKALPELIAHKPVPNIDTDASNSAEWTVFKTIGKGADAPRLFFTIFEGDNGTPVVLKLAVATYNKQQGAMKLMHGGERTQKFRQKR